MQRLTVRLKLTPDPETRKRLLAFISDVNEACNWMSQEAWIAQTFRRFALHHIVYFRAKEIFGLGGTAACMAIAKVAQSYELKRSKPTQFRALGAVPIKACDMRITDDTVRIALVGNAVTIPFQCRRSDRAFLVGHKQASVGVTREGALFLSVAVEVETPELAAQDVIGVDLGVANIATDSEGTRYSGAELRGVRYRRRRLRARLQSKGTRSAKRRLKRMRRRETRFARDVNHCISKRIVADAERTKSAIALEELRHIRTRIRASRQQRAVLHSWSFGQLRQFVTYKAALAGVPLIFVDPRNTSRECSSCGHIDKRNRPNQATFRCRMCGFATHADYNAALVIRDRGRAALSQPYAPNAQHLGASPLLDI